MFLFSRFGLIRLSSSFFCLHDVVLNILLYLSTCFLNWMMDLFSLRFANFEGLRRY